MNQKTLQMIYKTYQTQEFFKRYLVGLGCREDRRKIEEHRPIKITARNNSVVVSSGQTIVIAHIDAELQSVTFSPVSLTFGEPLLKLQVASGSQTKYREIKQNKAIEQYISKQINWAAIEDQLVGSDINTGKQYGYKGDLSVRIIGDDGCASESALLAVELLLWTCKFKKFTINKQKIEFGEQYKLQLHQFLFPLKYCYILDRILADPSLSEQQNCDFLVTVLKNVKDMSVPPCVIHHSRKDYGKMNEALLKRILAQWQTEIQMIAFCFQRMLSELQEKKQFILFAKESV